MSFAPDANGHMDGYCGSLVASSQGTLLSYGGSWDGNLVAVVPAATPVEQQAVQVNPKVAAEDSPKQPQRDDEFHGELDELKKAVPPRPRRFELPP